VATEIGPVVAPAGTLALIWLSDWTVKVAAVPLKATALAPPRPVPAMLTWVPAGPEAGVKPVRLGALPTWNEVALVAVPRGVATAIGPEVAPAGTVAVIWLSEITWKTALVPLNDTVLAVARLAPETVTWLAAAPTAGEKPAITGALPTTKSVEVSVLPKALSTRMGPVVAPLGTVAAIRKSETGEKLADVPLNETTLAPLKFAPSIVTESPTFPDSGEKVLTTGPLPTVKEPALVPVPKGVVTEIGPETAPAGTAASITVDEITVKLAAVPLKATPVASKRSEPVIVTRLPTPPEAGENELTTGALPTRKAWALETLPEPVVTVMGPVLAEAGTVARSWLEESTL
jgi:hypothetical protein